MTENFEVPPGYILVKTGGRPKKTLRDIAVFIAHPMKKKELGKGYLADEWIVDNFKLTDSGHIRKCRQHARKAVSKRWIAFSPNDRFTMMFPVQEAQKGVVIPSGTVGWGWAEGLLEALELKMKSDVCLSDIVNSQKMIRQDKKDNW